jgi:hypothetical protein
VHAGEDQVADGGSVRDLIERRIDAVRNVFASYMSPRHPSILDAPQSRVGVSHRLSMGGIIVRTVEAVALIEAIGERYRSHKV